MLLLSMQEGSLFARECFFFSFIAYNFISVCFIQMWRLDVFNIAGYCTQRVTTSVVSSCVLVKDAL